jgi:hypothetical protein
MYEFMEMDSTKKRKKLWETLCFTLCSIGGWGFFVPTLTGAWHGMNTDTVSFWHLWIYCARQLFLKSFRGIYVCMCVWVCILRIIYGFRLLTGGTVEWIYHSHPHSLSLIEGDKWKLQRIPKKKINGFAHSFLPYHRHTRIQFIGFLFATKFFEKRKNPQNSRYIRIEREENWDKNIHYFIKIKLLEN